MFIQVRIPYIEDTAFQKFGDKPLCAVYSVFVSFNWKVLFLFIENPPLQAESVSVVCFVDGLLVCGYSSGRLEIWHHNSLLYSNKVKHSG